MDILSSLFHQPRSHHHHGVEFSYSLAPTSSPKKRKRPAAVKPTTPSPVVPKAPRPTMRKQSPKSPQRKTASANLRLSIAQVLQAFEERGLSPIILKELKNHLAFYEYNFALTKCTTCFRSYFPQDGRLLRLLSNAWTCQWQYLQVVIREADKEYWKQQEQQVFVPVEEAEYRIRLERALTRCQEIRKELCDRQEVSLTLL